MSNTEKIGLHWRGKAWADGEPVARVTLPDGTIAEAVVSMNYVWDGTTGVFIKAPGAAKYAKIVASASGATVVVAAVPTKKIRVLSYVLISNGSVNVKFQTSDTSPYDVTGLLYLVANTGASSGFSPVGHFEALIGEALKINLSGAVAVGGHLSYLEV